MTLQAGAKSDLCLPAQEYSTYGRYSLVVSNPNKDRRLSWHQGMTRLGGALLWWILRSWFIILFVSTSHEIKLFIERLCAYETNTTTH